MRLLASAAVLALLTGCASAPGPRASAPAASPASPAPKALSAAPTPQEVAAADENLWLEEVESDRALTWVRDQNARSEQRLAADPRYEALRREALAILTATDRIPYPSARAGGLDNFWQDASNLRGLWRRTTPDAYASADTRWETILDLDALSRAEGVNWVWKGATCLDPDERYCLLRLSNGGKDAVSLREYDTVEKRFVPNGFSLPEGKQYVEWMDRDTLLVGRDWGGGTLTESGYPYVLKIVKRGQPAEQAREVFRGQATDTWATPIMLHDASGALAGVIVNRGLTFFEFEHHLLTDAGPVKLDMPRRAEIQTFVDGQVIFTTNEDWKGFKAGALLAYDLAALKRDPASARAELVFQPNERQAIEQVDSSSGRLIVNLFEDVKGAVDVYDRRGGAWVRTRLALPTESTFTIRTTAKKAERLYVTAEGFLTPTTLYAVDLNTGRATAVRSLPARFDASRHQVDQHFATSTDGTRVPYFVVRPRDLAMNGQAATILHGYGGFQIAKPPVYLPEMGKLWLERGGVFVVANIRGGGEFGPRWHQAALRERRQASFDDFHAVAEDLIRRGITSPERLGIYGRSNGGVLTSVAITQRPELYDAAVIESPLVDMLRYHELPAGASWIGEYGDPRVPEDAAFIAGYSAYQKLRPGVRYPEPYVTTNTRDDRVHPGHARKFVARMQAMGYPAIYHETLEGGHSNDSDPELNAARWARHYVYFSQKLMD